VSGLEAFFFVGLRRRNGLGKAPCMFDIVGTSAMARLALSSQLSPDELNKLAETQIAQARQIEPGPERLRVLTVADALMNLAEIKKLLLDCERRLLN